MSKSNGEPADDEKTAELLAIVDRLVRERDGDQRMGRWERLAWAVLFLLLLWSAISDPALGAVGYVVPLPPLSCYRSHIGAAPVQRPGDLSAWPWDAQGQAVVDTAAWARRYGILPSLPYQPAGGFCWGSHGGDWPDQKIGSFPQGKLEQACRAGYPLLAAGDGTCQPTTVEVSDYQAFDGGRVIRWLQAQDAPPPPPARQCSDGIDNDGDGCVDMADLVCKHPGWYYEAPRSATCRVVVPPPPPPEPEPEPEPTPEPEPLPDAEICREWTIRVFTPSERSTGQSRLWVSDPRECTPS
jgi:hypothetical protein